MIQQSENQKNFFNLIISQHYLEIEGKKEFVKNQADRNLSNEVSETKKLYNENIQHTSGFLLEDIMRCIEDRIGDLYPKRVSYLYSTEGYFDDKKFLWEYPIIFKIQFQSKTEQIIECKFVFDDDDWEKFSSNLEKIYHQKFGLRFKEDLGNNEKIKWQNIEFREGKLYVTYKDKEYNIPCESSSLNLNSIKRSYFPKAKFQLHISRKETTFKIENTEVLVNIIAYLKSLNKMENSPDLDFEKYLMELQNHEKSILKTLISDRYIRCLIDLQSADYTIIPVLEFSNESLEPSYIFTVTENKKIYIIWENTFDNRATYLFKTFTENYFKDCKNIYDFIREELLRKKIEIKYYDKKFSDNASLNYQKKIYHTKFNDWLTALIKEFHL